MWEAAHSQLHSIIHSAQPAHKSNRWAAGQPRGGAWSRAVRAHSENGRGVVAAVGSVGFADDPTTPVPSHHTHAHTHTSLPSPASPASTPSMDAVSSSAVHRAVPTGDLMVRLVEAGGLEGSGKFLGSPFTHPPSLLRRACSSIKWMSFAYALLPLLHLCIQWYRVACNRGGRCGGLRAGSATHQGEGVQLCNRHDLPVPVCSGWTLWQECRCTLEDNNHMLGCSTTYLPAHLCLLQCDLGLSRPHLVHHSIGRNLSERGPCLGFYPCSVEAEPSEHLACFWHLGGSQKKKVAVIHTAAHHQHKRDPTAPTTSSCWWGAQTIS